MSKGIHKTGTGAGRKSDKQWRDALILAVNEPDPHTRVKKLRMIAEKVCELALAGDMNAVKEIGDRIDGKPVQAIDVTETTHEEALAKLVSVLQQQESDDAGRSASPSATAH